MRDRLTFTHGTFTISDGTRTLDVPYTDGKLQVDPIPAAPTTLSGVISMRGTWSAAVTNLHIGTPKPLPVRLRVGKRWAWVRATGAYSDTPDRLTVTGERLSPWRRWYGPGQRRPARSRVRSIQ